jgi:hypothetical protein
MGLECAPFVHDIIEKKTHLLVTVLYKVSINPFWFQDVCHNVCIWVSKPVSIPRCLPSAYTTGCAADWLHVDAVWYLKKKNRHALPKRMYIEKYSEFFENALGSQTTGREYHYKNNSFFFQNYHLPYLIKKSKILFQKFPVLKVNKCNCCRRDSISPYIFCKLRN